MTKTCSPRWRAKLLAAYAFAYLACGMACNMVGPALGDLAARAHVRPRALGVLFLASLGGTISVIPTGLLLDRVPARLHHVPLAAAYLLMGLFFAGMAGLASTVAGLVAYRAGADVFVAGAVTATNVSVRRAYRSSNKRGGGRAYQVAMNLTCGLWGVGSVLSPAVARARSEMPCTLRLISSVTADCSSVAVAT